MTVVAMATRRELPASRTGRPITNELCKLASVRKVLKVHVARAHTHAYRTCTYERSCREAKPCPIAPPHSLIIAAHSSILPLDSSCSYPLLVEGPKPSPAHQRKELIHYGVHPQNTCIGTCMCRLSIPTVGCSCLYIQWC